MNDNNANTTSNNNINNNNNKKSKSSKSLKLFKKKTKNGTSKQRSSKIKTSALQFCSCKKWTFQELRQFILTSQSRSCPICRHKFEKITLVEKTMTVFDLIFSLQGLLLIIIYLIQYSILYYIAFLAFADCGISSQMVHYDGSSRCIMFVLTILFIICTIYSMLMSIYTTAQALCDQVDDKVIVDVICDPALVTQQQLQNNP